MDAGRITAPLILPDISVKKPSESVSGDSEKLKEKKLHKACADFESILIYQMLKTMRKTVPASGLLDKMGGKESYEMLMDQKVSEELAKKSGVGIQNVLFNQLSRTVK
jgi:flagellar protein FlgJ